MLRDFEQQVMPAVTHWNHPGFFAYFGTTGSTPAILADMLSAALNTNGLHWKTSPAVAELEQVTLGWLREWIGLPPEFFGIIYDTASTSSMHALVAARELSRPEARVEGSTPNMVVYTSEQSHSSIEKGAIAIGIGQKNVRKVPVDAEFRMRPDALARLIEEDCAAGKQPICVVATVGTTSVDQHRSGGRNRRDLRAARPLAAHRRRLRRHGRHSARVQVHSARRRARALAGDEPAQVDAHADRLQRVLHPPSGHFATGLFARARILCAPPTTRAPFT